MGMSQSGRLKKAGGQYQTLKIGVVSEHMNQKIPNPNPIND
jgi:hypothetical protein